VQQGRDGRVVTPCQFSRKNADQKEQRLTIGVNPWVEKLLGRFGQYPPAGFEPATDGFRKLSVLRFLAEKSDISGQNFS
jgi:hypothetical protein